MAKKFCKVNYVNNRNWICYFQDKSFDVKEVSKLEQLKEFEESFDDKLVLDQEMNEEVTEHWESWGWKRRENETKNTCIKQPDFSPRDQYEETQGACLCHAHQNCQLARVYCQVGHALELLCANGGPADVLDGSGGLGAGLNQWVAGGKEAESSKGSSTLGWWIW